jgi:WD repeat-containing protein 20
MGNSSPSAGFVTALGSSAQRGLEYDLLIGTSTGEIKAMSVVAQLASPPTAIRPIKALTFNSGGAVNPTRCIAVAFVPGTSGASFLSVHADGTVLQHLLPAVAQQPGISSETAAAAPQLPPATQLVGPGSPAAAAAVSPDGSLLAVAGRHGTLRVYDTTTGALQCGFHSYYGGFLCCAWSPDGRCVAAGGEDDLVAVYSLEERAVIAHCQGHSSFLSSVAFDPHAPVEPDLIRYRIASVAQDCQVALWEVEVLGEGKGGASWAAAKGVRGGGGGLGLGRVAPSLPRAEMCFVAPLVHKKVHYEPLSDVKFVKDGLLVAGFDGIVKKWARPPEQGSLAGSHMA